MILLKNIINEVLLKESVAKDHKVLHALAQDILRQFVYAKNSMPMRRVSNTLEISDFVYTLTVQDFGKIAARFNISTTLQNYIDHLTQTKAPQDPILIVEFHNNANEKYRAEFNEVTNQRDVAQLIININRIPLSTNIDGAKSDIATFFYSKGIINHELQHWYDFFRIKNLDSYIVQPYKTLDAMVKKRNIANFYDDPELRQFYENIPGEIWANASAELDYINTIKPTELLRIYFIDRQNKLRSFINDLLRAVKDDYPLRDAEAQKLRKRLIKLFYKVIEDRISELSRDGFTRAIIDLLKKDILVLRSGSGMILDLRSAKNYFDYDIREQFFTRIGNSFKLRNGVEIIG